MLEEASTTETAAATVPEPEPVTAVTAPINPALAFDEADIDPNLPPPKPDLDAMLYGLVGDIARVGTAESEANPVAVGLNFLAYYSAMVGRDVYLPIANTFHHARLFVGHVGRTSEGRKGDATGIVKRIHGQIGAKHNASLLGQIHGGGLSTPEGLIRLIHDGFGTGKNCEPAILDKRLLIEEPEFGSTLVKLKKPGNTLSAALRIVCSRGSKRPLRRLWIITWAAARPWKSNQDDMTRTRSR